MYELLFKNLKPNDSIVFEAPNRTSLTYKELDNMLIALKKNFQELSITTTDPIAIVLPNGPDLGMLFLAACCFGIAAPLNPNYSKKEFLFFLKDLKTKVLITDPTQKSSSRLAAEELRIPIIDLIPNEKAGQFFLKSTSEPPYNSHQNKSFNENTALLLHTSGTTSKPKLVQLTAENLTTSAIGGRELAFSVTKR